MNLVILGNEEQTSHTTDLGSHHLQAFLASAVTNLLFQTVTANTFLRCLITLGLSQCLSHRQ